MRANVGEASSCTVAGFSSSKLLVPWELAFGLMRTSGDFEGGR